MRKNKKILKITTGMISSLLIASTGININAQANHKVNLQEIIPNNEEINFSVEEEKDNKIKIKITAKKDVKNVSLKFLVDNNKRYTYNYKQLKKDEVAEIEIDLTEKKAKKLLPQTSAKRKVEKIYKILKNHIINGELEYTVEKPTKDTTTENNKQQNKENTTTENNKQGNKEETTTEDNKQENINSITITVNKDNIPLINSNIRLIKKENNIPNIYGTFKTNEQGTLKIDHLEKNSDYEIWMSNNDYKYDKDHIEFSTDDNGNIKLINGEIATKENTNVEFKAHNKQDISDNVTKVTFKVIDKDTGMPEENVQLTANIINPKLSSYKNATTDKNGDATFELEGTEEGKIYTVCIAKNHQFLYDFEPEEITIKVSNKDKNIVLENADKAIFKVKKNDRLYLKENLKNKINEAEKFIEKNSKLNTLKLEQLVEKSKEELEKETIPVYVEGYTNQIIETLNELKKYINNNNLENIPNILHVKDSTILLNSSENDFNTRIFGKNLTNDLKIFVKEVVDNKEIDSEDITIKEVVGEKQGFKDITLSVVANKNNYEKVYKVYYGYGENASDIYSNITVKPTLNEEVTVTIPTILVNYNNNIVLDPLNFKILEKDSNKFVEVSSDMSMLSNIEVKKDKEYTIYLKDNDKYTMEPVTFVVDNEDGEPKILGSNETLFQLNLSKKIVTPIITDYSIDKEILTNLGGKVTVELSGENLNHSDYGTRIKVVDIATSSEEKNITNNIVYRKDGDKLYADINFPENNSNKTKSYSLTIYSNLNKVFNKTGNKSQRAVISVLPSNVESLATTLSDITINSYATNSTGSINDEINPKHTVTSTNQESKKTEVKLYGTNLKENVTKVRIFDENGVEWPIFTAGSSLSGIYPKMILPGTTGIGNGVVGNGNFQILEVILPNELSKDMTYSYYISIDGSGELIEDNKVTATVKSGSATSEKVNLDKKTIIVKYQDENGEKIKEDKIISGYSWFNYAIEKDNIENYTFKNVEKNIELVGTFGTEDKEIILTYSSNNSVENQDEEVTFKDNNFKNFILEKLHNYNGEDEFEEDMNEYNFKLTDKNYRKDLNSNVIYKIDLEKIESLALRGWNNDFEVTDLTGVEKMINLKTLTISSNNTETPNSPTAITNLEPLKNLTKLELLRLSHNGISDVTPLSNLKLKKLYLSHNKINDISPLANLTTLEDLDIAVNGLTDYNTVSKLSNLKMLDIRKNNINSLSPVENLTNINFLIADSNQITDIGNLAKLTNLEQLFIDNNFIKDFSVIKNFTKLKTLFYNNQNITLDNKIVTNKKEFSITSPYTSLNDISKGDIAVKIINISKKEDLDAVTASYNLENNKLNFTLNDNIFNSENNKELNFDIKIVPINKFEYFGENFEEPLYIKDVNISLEKTEVITNEEVKTLEQYKEELQKLAIAPSKLPNKENIDPSLLGEYSKLRKELLKKLGANEFTEDSIKEAIDNIKSLIEKMN